MKLYNTLSRKKEEFTPLEENIVKMYTCGQTVYESLHIGNARAYTTWDILKRYLRFKGFKILHVQNFTDVGHLTDDADMGMDKIELAARRVKAHPMAIVDKYIREFWEDYRHLNIIPPDIAPRATGHIIEMIELVKLLLEKGFAYEKNGNVYFDISRFPGYTDLVGVDLEQLRAGTRVQIDPNKDDPLDFALWIKAPKKHILKWPSPWGLGYPGWHLECSTMAMKYLGETIDIHGGGEDHIFPHHTNERAQSEAATGKIFALYWLHVRFLRIDKQRMGKSLGNVIRVKEILQKVHPNVLRIFYVSKHYRKPLDFSEEELANAKNIHKKLLSAVAFSLHSKGGIATDLEKEITQFKDEFINAMDDDLNTPLALKYLLRLANKILASPDNKKDILLKARKALIDYSQILGLSLEQKLDARTKVILDLITSLRKEFRRQRNFKIADMIREKLTFVGVLINDVNSETYYYLVD